MGWLVSALGINLFEVLLARPYATKRLAESLAGGNVERAKRTVNDEVLEQRVKQVQEYKQTHGAPTQ